MMESRMRADKNYLIHVGHSTVFIHLDGRNIITDPNWNNKNLFLKRITPPPFGPEQLPLIDLVLVSHGHFDHMDIPTLEKIYRINNKVMIYVPENLGSVLKRSGITNYKELTDSQSVPFENIIIESHKAKHDGRRYVIDNTGLSLCFLIKGSKTLFFSGDTGYTDLFKTLGRQQKIDIAMIMIGGWKIPYLFQSTHLRPSEAIQVFLDLKAKRLLPIHYDTFPLGREKKGESVELLKYHARKLKLEKKLIINKFGDKIFF